QGNASIDNADGRKPWVLQDGVTWLNAVVRVAPPMTLAVATARIDAINRQNLETRAMGMQNADRRTRVMREHIELQPGARGLSCLRGTFSQALIILMSTVALVLLVACANLANLLMARNAARGQEFALRLS